MVIKHLPQELNRLLRGMVCEINDVGRTSASVYRYYNDKIACYLKIQPPSQGLAEEYEIMKWLQEKLPVPRMLCFNCYDGLDYLLMTEVNGEMACSDKYMSKPMTTIKLLADGIKRIHSVPIDNCPFFRTLDIKLNEARDNIRNNLVDMSDFEANNHFDTPHELLEYLMNNKPLVSELAFTHGDYCFPNILFDNDRISGFIDLGRGGVADIYQDIALCVRSMRHNFGVRASDYIDLFFEHLGLKPDWEKIDYYILLDELF